MSEDCKDTHWRILLCFLELVEMSGLSFMSIFRLAPVLKTIFHQCVISYTYSQSYYDGSVLKQSHQS